MFRYNTFRYFMVTQGSMCAWHVFNISIFRILLELWNWFLWVVNFRLARKSSIKYYKQFVCMASLQHFQILWIFFYFFILFRLKLDIWICLYLDIWIGYLDIWIGYLDIWIFGYLDIWIFRYLDILYVFSKLQKISACYETGFCES